MCRTSYFRNKIVWLQFNEIGDEKAYVYLYPLDDLVIISHISTSSAS